MIKPYFEIPFSTFEDGDVWTNIEYIREKEETVKTVYQFLSPKGLPLNTHLLKEEDIGPMDMVISEDKNVSDSTIEAYTKMHSPDYLTNTNHNNV